MCYVNIIWIIAVLVKSLNQNLKVSKGIYKSLTFLFIEKAVPVKGTAFLTGIYL